MRGLKVVRAHENEAQRVLNAFGCRKRVNASTGYVEVEMVCVCAGCKFAAWEMKLDDAAAAG
jgi:hypothetical protein